MDDVNIDFKKLFENLFTVEYDNLIKFFNLPLIPTEMEVLKVNSFDYIVCIYNDNELFEDDTKVWKSTFRLDIYDEKVYKNYIIDILRKHCIECAVIYNDAYEVVDTKGKVYGFRLEISLVGIEFVLPEPEETEGGYETWMM